MINKSPVKGFYFYNVYNLCTTRFKFMYHSFLQLYY